MASTVKRGDRIGRWYAPSRGGYSAVGEDEAGAASATQRVPPKNPASASPRPGSGERVDGGTGQHGR